MTRDELEAELETILIGTPKMSDVMAIIDSYVATERHEIEQQIGEHTGYRLQAQRERIAQAIEVIPIEYKHGNDRYPGYVRTEAARIARAES